MELRNGWWIDSLNAFCNNSCQIYTLCKIIQKHFQQGVLSIIKSVFLFVIYCWIQRQSKSPVCCWVGSFLKEKLNRFVCVCVRASRMPPLLSMPFFLLSISLNILPGCSLHATVWICCPQFTFISLLQAFCIFWLISTLVWYWSTSSRDVN